MDTVSVIIPTNNERPEFLKETIKSIESQTYPCLEIIVEVGEGVWDSKNNMYAKLNKGISKSKGEFFIPLGDDDKLAPTYIEKTLEILHKEESDIAGTFLHEFGERDGIHGPGKLPFVTALCRKNLWQKVGGYDEEGGMAGDYDFWWMCYEQGARISILSEPLFLYRTHPGQISRSGDWEASTTRMYKKHGSRTPERRV